MKNTNSQLTYRNKLCRLSCKILLYQSLKDVDIFNTAICQVQAVCSQSGANHKDFNPIYSSAVHTLSIADAIDNDFCFVEVSVQLYLRTT